MSRDLERGAGRLKSVVALLVLAFIVLLAIKVVPAYINNYQLEEAIKTEARFSAVQKKSPEEVRDIIYKKIVEIGIPARREDIRVEPAGRGVRITVNYAVEVSLPGYQFTLEFHPSADSSSL